MLASLTGIMDGGYQAAAELLAALTTGLLFGNEHCADLRLRHPGY